ncbi:protein phosphatase regulator, partial [Linderina macrospora]
MEDLHELVDVLLLSDCNLYERYPELVQRVDYFLYDWTEHTLARTQALLRRHAKQLKKPIANSTTCYQNNGEDESFTHARSVNVVWRQWAVGRLQLPRYPPERINWNKDADPVFLYAPMPALRLEVSWSVHTLSLTPKENSPVAPNLPAARAATAPIAVPLKPALKRTDLQTFLTSPTLSPASSPPYSPLHSPAMSIRESMSTSSLGSDTTLENTPAAQEGGVRPRLRFNDQVEQCMVVFKQERECLPTDYEDNCDEEGDAAMYYANNTPARRSQRGGTSRGRRSLVIKLAPTQLKGDHRRLTASSAPATSPPPSMYEDSDDEDLFNDFNSGIALFGGPTPGDRITSGHSSHSNLSGDNKHGVSGYVQGYVQSVAGQVRRFVSDAVSVSSFTVEKQARSTTHSAGSSASAASYVPDPFAARHSQQQQPAKASTSPYVSGSANAVAPNGAASCHQAATTGASGIVRDPFAAANRRSSHADHVPFDDDEDAIIQEFEREMQQYHYKPAASASAAAAASTASQPSPPLAKYHAGYAQQ